MFAIDLIVRPGISLADQPFDPINPWLFESGDFECVEDLLSHLCDQMQQTDAVDFLMSGFGQAIWPCEVRVEFCIFLEQLPTLYSGLISKSEYIMFDFFEQGMERTIVFRFKEEELLVAECSCTGWELKPEWEPDPSEEVILLSDLMTMLNKTFVTFLNVVKEMNPELYAHCLFQEWANQPSLKSLNNPLVRNLSMKRSYTKSLAVITAFALAISLFTVHYAHAQSSETPLTESAERTTVTDANRVRVAVFCNDKDFYIYVVYALEAARIPYYVIGSPHNYEVFVNAQDADRISQLLLADSKRFRYEIFVLSPNAPIGSFPAIFGYPHKKRWFESKPNSKMSKKRFQEMIEAEEQDYSIGVASFLRNEDTSKRVANALAEADIDCLFYTDLGAYAIFIDVFDVRRAIEVLTTDVQKYKYDICIDRVDYISGVPPERKPTN